jgi:acetyl esterase/lipase
MPRSLRAFLLLLPVILLPGALVYYETPPAGELLWPEGAPGAQGQLRADKPAMTLLLPSDRRTDRAAVIVCPGGSYRHLFDGHEGREPAEWLRKRGAVGIVLRYRIAPRYGYPAPMLDLQRAIRMVRARASEWGVDPQKVGVWGFSAGGHLASAAATSFDSGNPGAFDPIERVSCRPDFAILCYPVISLIPPVGHGLSRENLLGPNPDQKLVESLCTDTQVTAQSPPTFLFHTNTDEAISPENSIRYYQALRKWNVPVELHVYERGRHGIGLATDDPVVSTWTARLQDWMTGKGLLTGEK